MASPDVLAAGSVVFRPGREVLLVHRERYDDWSFPKGKADPGEHLTVTAVREVEEETGLRIRLGVPLESQRYATGSRMKSVSYWVGRVVGDDDVSGYQPNAEIDQVLWVGVDKARELLTYPHDRRTLAEALTERRRTWPLVVLRHALARPRKEWRSEDRDRPLQASGRSQAGSAVPILDAYGVRRVASSPSTRCVETIAPYLARHRLDPDLRPDLSEEDATAGEVTHLVRGLVETLPAAGPTMVCTHRPVLPHVFDGLGLIDPRLEPGEMMVVHLRKGTVQATERHLAG